MFLDGTDQQLPPVLRTVDGCERKQAIRNILLPFFSMNQLYLCSFRDFSLIQCKWRAGLNKIYF